MRKPRFRRGMSCVVVRPFTLGGEVLQPGFEISENMPTVRLRRLYRRNRLGPIGHEWTEMMLKTWEDGEPSKRATRKTPSQTQTNQPLVDLMTSQAARGAAGQSPLAQLMSSQAARNGTMEHVGGGYFYVWINNQRHRVKGKGAAQELLDSGV